jgi:hypothetical protein
MGLEIMRKSTAAALKRRVFEGGVPEGAVITI